MILRLVTHLAPGLDASLFGRAARIVASTLGVAVELSYVEDASGPDLDGEDPLAAEGADLAWICTPSYVALRDRRLARLVPAGLVPLDPLAGGRPVFHSDVVVGVSTPADHLERRAWAYNDDESLSGLGCVLATFGEVQRSRSGSHEASLQMVADGQVDAAAVDRNVLWRLRRDRPDLLQRVRTVATLGPYPMQPLVARVDVPDEVVDGVARALVSSEGWEPYGFAGFVTVREADYR